VPSQSPQNREPQLPDEVEVLGIRRWKRWQIDLFLRPRCARVHYAASEHEALRRQRRHRGAILVWASRESEQLAERAAAQDAPLWRIEDGFIRSVGLGANHVGGASLVLDPLGIYFDPRRPSWLERLLGTKTFSTEELARAARLRQLLVETRLTKYNVGELAAPKLGGEGRRRVLVVGQVEADASILRGAAEVRGNLALLQAARAAEPDAWLVYKPHPDIDAGTREGRLDDAAALRVADEIVRNVSTAALFPLVACAHVITSLAGFEALLRGVDTVTWGRPFYAGWGLTEDRAAQPGRGRARSLDELVAATLIDYPRYVHPATGAPCEVEDVIAALRALPPSPARREASRLRRNLLLMRGALRSLGWPRRG
jgi:capsular polysaccharide export protein